MARKTERQFDRDSLELLETSWASDGADESATTSTGEKLSLNGSPIVLAAVGLSLMALLFAVLRDSGVEPAAIDGGEIGNNDAEFSLAEPRVTTPPPSTLPDGELLLGEPTGLWLFYGGDDPLQRLDLDNGEFVTYGIRANPVFATGSSLVISQTGLETLSSWVGLADPGEQPHIWKTGPVARAATEGDLWIYERPTPERAEPRWTRFAAAEHRMVERREVISTVPADDGVGRSRALVPGPDLISDDGQTYEYVNGRYELRGPGSILAYDDGHALTVQCPDEKCYVQWMARASWEPFGFPTPYDPPADVELLAGASWLYLVSDDIRPSNLVDGAGPQTPTEKHRHEGLGGDGRTIELLPTAVFGSYYFGEGTAVNISPDGRWLAWEKESGSVGIRNLKTDDVYEIDSFDRSRNGSLLFVDKGRVNR